MYQTAYSLYGLITKTKTKQGLKCTCVILNNVDEQFILKINLLWVILRINIIFFKVQINEMECGVTENGWEQLDL